MINPDDPKEWLAQIEAAPESAASIAKLLVERLARLEEANEELRNTNIDLRQKIDTKAHQKEVDELSRQIEALARLVKARAKGHAPAEALIAWASNGHALALELGGQLDETSLQAYAFRFPASVRLHLLAAPVADEILFLTNLGQGTVGNIQDLLQITQDSARWHKIPGLNLIGGEFVSAAAPIGDLPLCHSLITASRAGYARSILRWSMDRLLQEAQFGKGIQHDWDAQVCAALCASPASNLILFTERGNYVRFPQNSLSVSLMQAIKLDEGEHIAALVMDDQAEQVLLVDSEGKGIRRSIKSLPAKSLGTRPQPACSAGEPLGACPIDDYDRVVALMKNGRLAIFDADQAPLANKARSLASLPAITHGVQAFTTARNF